MYLDGFFGSYVLCKKDGCPRPAQRSIDHPHNKSHQECFDTCMYARQNIVSFRTENRNIRDGYFYGNTATYSSCIVMQLLATILLECDATLRRRSRLSQLLWRHDVHTNSAAPPAAIVFHTLFHFGSPKLALFVHRQ